MTSPSEDYAALRDHVLVAMEEKRPPWDQGVLARVTELDLRTINKVCSRNPSRVGGPTYAAVERALGWPPGQCRRILHGEALESDGEAPPSIETALKRLATAQESLAAAERILRLLQAK